MMSVALSLIAKATVVSAFALIAGWLARRRRAAVRHLIFLAAFAVLALLPAATAVMPAIPVPLQLLAMPETAGTVRAISLNRAPEPVDALTFPAGRPAEPRASNRTSPALSTRMWLLIVWLAGVIGCLVPVALGLWQIRRVRRQ